MPKPNGWDDVACERIITDNGLGVYIADARQGDVNGKATIILPQWSDGTLHNPLSQERAKATAAIKGDVAIYVDNPGVEPDLPEMPGYIKRALSSGDFKPGAIKQWDAIAQGLDYAGLDFNSVSRVLGASLGAHVASAIVCTAPEEVHLERMDLWETAGLGEESNFLQFAANFMMHGGDGYADILKNNPEWVAYLRKINGAKELANIAIRRTAGLFYYPWAINRHDIGNTIIEAKNRKNPAIDGDTALTILNGTESKVSPSEFNDRLALRLAESGLRVVRLMSEGGVHASQDNIGWWTEAERYSGYEAV
ncbi:MULTISPECIES: hypothetical protein [unclassified Candidatus Nanosynbacter]|uniref:hypothetical protein n=1 Tax=unclassified Candidatus Nanosynbacter TaxID=2725944 RepID=UPI001FB678C7|nr:MULTISPECIES: hypothetical protein [unclassified Candidatus Nanosynbacter]MCJ1963326.1 hypothetical protein [Candidatus Nanosynbacter sp. TM7-033]UOG67815.1 hypothetical protein LRM46_03340 [Candidatus Nanosynbacter sp. HMT-352]